MPADIQHSRIKMRNGKNFVAVAGLEPASSARMRRFANLASRHTVPLSCAADFLRHYVQQCGVSSRHRREGAKLIPLILVSVVRSSTSGLLVASDTDNTPLRHRNHCRSGVQRLEPPPCCQSCLFNMSKNVSPFIVCGRCRIRTCGVW